jgi:hypothetical protein
MKKFGLQALIILIGGFIAHQFLPFWAVAIVAGTVGLFFFYENSAVSFAAGFAAASLLWSGYAGFLNATNLNLLSGKMGELFHINGSYLVYLTGMVGGLLGGLGAMTGSLARKLFERKSGVTA